MGTHFRSIAGAVFAAAILSTFSALSSAQAFPITFTDSAGANITVPPTVDPFNSEIVLSPNGDSFSAVGLNDSLDLAIGSPTDIANLQITWDNPANLSFDSDLHQNPISHTLVLTGFSQSIVLNLNQTWDVFDGIFPTSLVGPGGVFVFELPEGTLTATVNGLEGFDTATTTLFFTQRVITDVPEPATWGMLLIGLVGAGFLMRGSRRKQGALAA